VAATAAAAPRRQRATRLERSKRALLAFAQAPGHYADNRYITHWCGLLLRARLHACSAPLMTPPCVFSPTHHVGCSVGNVCLKTWFALFLALALPLRYRPQGDWRRSLGSLFRLHNETGNVWTHLVGFLIFLCLTAATVHLRPAPLVSLGWWWWWWVRLRG
jgi:hypothetical protein